MSKQDPTRYSLANAFDLPGIEANAIVGNAVGYAWGWQNLGRSICDPKRT